MVAVPVLSIVCALLLGEGAERFLRWSGRDGHDEWRLPDGNVALFSMIFQFEYEGEDGAVKLRFICLRGRR